MTLQETIDDAMAMGHRYAAMADRAHARGDHLEAIRLNRIAIKAFTRAESASVELEEGS